MTGKDGAECNRLAVDGGYLSTDPKLGHFRMKMKLPLQVLMSSVLLLATGCRKDPELPVPPVPWVKVTVEPRWQGGPFDKTQVYLNPAGQRVQVQQLKMYLSRFTLMGDGEAQELFDADLFSLADGPVSRTFVVSPDRISEVRFGLGLPPDINHRDITQVPVNDPLGNNSGMYWNWASLYRFVVFDGRFATDPDPALPLPFVFSLHTGLDTLYRSIVLPLERAPVAGDTTHVTVVVDIGRFFGNGAQLLDLSQGAQWHGTVEDLDLGIRVADLQRDAISVE